MCRNIHTLYNFEPPATSEEIHDASLQYVRKISGFTKPSQANEAGFRSRGRRDSRCFEAIARPARDVRAAEGPRGRGGTRTRASGQAIRDGLAARMVEEARLEETAGGLAPATEGWFVVNVRDGRWMTNAVLGDAFILEGDEVGFDQVGYTIGILQPGQSGGRYHRESEQEDFLVLAGRVPAHHRRGGTPAEAVGLRALPGRHQSLFVGAGDSPCVLFATGHAYGKPRGRLSTLGARDPSRRGCRDRDEQAGRGLCPVPEVAGRPAGELGRIALGLARSPRRQVRITAP